MSDSSWRSDLTSIPIEPKPSQKVPLVAIVGRPNVGKSTLFNRLIGKRKAITHSMAGVTRDPVKTRWQYRDREVFLVDTGGIRTEEVLPLDQLVIRKSFQVIREADCIILLVSIEGITGEDEELLEDLRPFSHKVLLVVNKVDTEERETQLGEFFGLGFGDPIPISAAHGRNCEELSERVFSFLDREGTFQEQKEVRETEGVEVLTLAVLGKPNTGKSTLVNRLLGKEVSIVSDIPGTTRDIVEECFLFEGKKIRIFDTAGIRRKTKVREDVEYYSVHRALEGIRDADVILLLIDAAEGLTEQDKKIAAQVVKKGRGIILAVNKWDIIKGGKRAVREVEDRIRFQFPVLDFAPILPISAKTGFNLETLMKTAFSLKKQLQTRIKTSTLNRALERWVERNPPPQVGKKRYKVRFITQVRASPVRFVLFVNRIEGFPSFYVGYIRNRLREEFQLSLIPIDIELKSRGSTS
ncbi:MAG: ribosome biogenesis GTPase Der [Spirochaetes bacterium]|nr:ribosome biogenesis GTPase Der [Spirochaetota bacterium]